MTGQQPIQQSKDGVLKVVQQYYDAKGTMPKTLAVGLILDELGLKYADAAGKVATCLM